MRRTAWTRRAAATTVAFLRLALRWAGRVALAAPVVACSETDPDVPGARAMLVRDSGGVEIVENRAPLWAEGEGWVVDPNPRVDVGGAPGPEDDLFRVSDVTRLGDGSVVVASSRPVFLRRYLPDGTLAATLGREGDGPGEFTSIRLVDAPGDTVVVWDALAARLTRLLPDGTLVDTRRVPQDRWSRRSPFALLPDGRLLASGADYPETWDELGRMEVPLGLDVIHPDGSQEAVEVDWLQDEELIVSLNPTTQRSLFFPPARTEVGFGAGRLYASLTLRPEIEVREPAGALRRLVRWEQPVRLVTEEAVDERARVRGFLVRGRDFDPADAADIDRAEIDVLYDSLPAHGGIEVDHEGNVWVRELDLLEGDGGSTRRFQVFDGEGRWLGLVELPEAFTGMEIGPDWVAGVWEDELEVEHVRVYGIRKGSG